MCACVCVGGEGGGRGADAPLVTRVCTASLFSAKKVMLAGDTLAPGDRLTMMPAARKASVKATTSAS